MEDSDGIADVDCDVDVDDDADDDYGEHDGVPIVLMGARGDIVYTTP